MALGATTYKTPNIINLIGSDMTAREGCGVYLQTDNTVALATTLAAPPYGIIVTGTDSLTPGTYPSAIGDASLELVDQIGCVIQVLINANSGCVAGEFLCISSFSDGTFDTVANQGPLVGDFVWGQAMTTADPGTQCLMRFQPYVIQ